MAPALTSPTTNGKRKAQDEPDSDSPTTNDDGFEVKLSKADKGKLKKKRKEEQRALVSCATWLAGPGGGVPSPHQI